MSFTDEETEGRYAVELEDAYKWSIGDYIKMTLIHDGRQGSQEVRVVDKRGNWLLLEPTSSQSHSVTQKGLKHEM